MSVRLGEILVKESLITQDQLQKALEFQRAVASRPLSSGIVKSYPMDFVDRIEARITVTVDPGKGYLIEAAIPLAELGLTPGSAVTLHGDFGVTHGGASGDRTRLRTFWSNQHTGIVDDSVYELMLEPRYWGELQFSP